MTVDRRAMTDVLVRQLTEPARKRVRAALAAIEDERSAGVVADLVRESRAPRALAILLALEAAEWRMTGALRAGSPTFPGAWFSLEAFPCPSRVRARVVERGPRVFVLEVEALEERGVSPALLESVRVLARELAKHLGSSVSLVGPI